MDEHYTDADFYSAVIDTPIGMIGVRCEGGGISAIDFHAEAEPRDADDPACKAACAQLHAYFEDPAQELSFPVRVRGTDFQQRVWRAMCAIPRGETRTYGDLARELGSSARAVGQACRNNPLPLIQPCHRVVSASGLGGFGGAIEGLNVDVKRWLLRHEGHCP